MYIFEVYGEPYAHQQPRRGRYGNVYSPDSTRYAQIQWQIKATAPKEPICGPVEVSYTFLVAIPKGTSSVRRRQMLNRLILPDKRPDEGNYTYFLDNALQGIVYDDDKRICAKHAYKFYGEEPKTVIRVRPIMTAEPYGMSDAIAF